MSVLFSETVLTRFAFGITNAAFVDLLRCVEVPFRPPERKVNGLNPGRSLPKDALGHRSSPHFLRDVNPQYFLSLRSFVI